MPNPRAKLQPYSVLLQKQELYPDYIASTFGQDTYFAHIMAFHPLEAVIIARDEATRGIPETEPADFAVLLVLKGHHDDIKP